MDTSLVIYRDSNFSLGSAIWIATDWFLEIVFPQLWISVDWLSFAPSLLRKAIRTGFIGKGRSYLNFSLTVGLQSIFILRSIGNMTRLLLRVDGRRRTSSNARCSARICISDRFGCSGRFQATCTAHSNPMCESNGLPSYIGSRIVVNDSIGAHLTTHPVGCTEGQHITPPRREIRGVIEPI